MQMYPNTFQLEVTFEPSNATDRRVSYESDNPSIATVDGSGLVTAIAVGSCNITVKSVDNELATATCQITVEEKFDVTGLDLGVSEKTLYIKAITL